MSERILITAALPYANGVLHFGHLAGAYLPADCYSKFERLLGNNVLFICGSDQYGVAVTMSAEAAGTTPLEHVTKYHNLNKELFIKAGIQFDHFSQTTCKEHEGIVREFFFDLLDQQYIQKKVTAQLYSEEENRFFADRYVVGTCPKCGFDKARGDECTSCAASYDATDLINPRSKKTGSKLLLKDTEHWFMRFDLFKEELTSFLNSKNWKQNVVAFAKPYIEELQPRPITRDLYWGVSLGLENTDGKVFYVWFDAPIGYISATMDWANLSGNPDAWKDYWMDKTTKYVQFIGKDNISFHAIFFPAMVMGQKKYYKLVDDLVANEFYNLEGRQFSKSDGHTIDCMEALEKYGSDAIRYYLCATAPESSDTEFSWKDFGVKLNSELVGKLGNLANRVLTFLQKNYNAIVPETKNLTAADSEFLAKLYELAGNMKLQYSSYRLRRAVTVLMEIAQLSNVFFDGKAPWKAVKQEETAEDASNTISCCIEALRVICIVSYPIMPNFSNSLWNLIGFNDSFPTNDSWQLIENNKKECEKKTLPIPVVLFSKIDPLVIQEESDKLSNK